jgi:plasmid stability protein
MATLTIRNLPDEIRDRLRVRAAENGRSMEAEARHLLADALAIQNPEPSRSAAERVARAQAIFAPYRREGQSLVDELLAERRAAAARGD